MPHWQVIYKYIGKGALTAKALASWIRPVAAEIEAKKNKTFFCWEGPRVTG